MGIALVQKHRMCLRADASLTWHLLVWDSPQNVNSVQWVVKKFVLLVTLEIDTVSSFRLNLFAGLQDVLMEARLLTYSNRTWAPVFLPETIGANIILLANSYACLVVAYVGRCFADYDKIFILRYKAPVRPRVQRLHWVRPSL